MLVRGGVVIDFLAWPRAAAVVVVALGLGLADFGLLLLVSSGFVESFEVELVALPELRFVLVERIALRQDPLKLHGSVVHPVAANGRLRHALALVEVLHWLAHAVLVERLVTFALPQLGLLGFELVDGTSRFGELDEFLPFLFEMHFVDLPEEFCLLLINVLGSLGLAS